MDTPDPKRPSGASDDDGRVRVSRRFLPIASVVGAFGVVAAAVMRPGSTPPASPTSEPAIPKQPPLPPLPQQYAQSAVVVGPGLPGEFRQTLAGLAVGPKDAVYVVGDGEVRVFEAAGRLLRGWPVTPRATCLGVAADGRVAVGSPGRVDLYSEVGASVGGFAVGSADKPGEVTAVRLVNDVVLVADASARVIRRYDAGGIERGTIGVQEKVAGFMLPNRSLDFDVDAAGVIHAADTGRHRVSSWTQDGAMVATFGRFGMAKPEDFVGCCNPVNVAVAPDGSVVTGEKVIPRVKVFGKDRSLLAVIGPEHFDPMCRHIHVAVDSTGRIVAADPERRTVAVFGRV
jgi:hypothetical protein